jgi:predicted Rossmann fold flavoprotein
MNQYDVIIVGAGAAGLMCAIEAAKRSRRVLVIDHSNKPGKKILMSGGGRCNFTNLNIKPERYLSHNRHFCKSALSRYTQWDFIEWVNKHKIAFHEKKLGQLFCDHKAKDILEMLLRECDQNAVGIHLNESVDLIEKKTEGFRLKTSLGHYACESLVIATGGLSIPTLGATPFGYAVAKQFGLNVWPTRAGLVPFVLSHEDKARFSPLSGISNESSVSVCNTEFQENILITHKGLSGPAILQISSYWKENDPVVIDLAPGINIVDILKQAQKQHPNALLKTVLGQPMSKRLVTAILGEAKEEQTLQSISHREFEAIAKQFHEWTVHPVATEGYRTAEVTLGGVDCDALSSKTMEANAVEGLYFIGEVVDVTGWLGGYNFQWAWSSGWAAGQVA